MSNFQAESIKLPGGQEVTITRYGSRDLAVPFFYLHGFPGSRIEGELAHNAALSLGISLIAIDRPGFGKTPDFNGRTFLDFPPLLKSLARTFGIQKFGLLAVSGGTPYALAAAAALKDAVVATGIVSGMGAVSSPELLKQMILPNRVLLRGARIAPHLSFGAAWCLAQWWRLFPQHIVRWLALFLPGEDRETLSTKALASFMKRNVAEGLLQGATSAAREVLLLAQPWGLNLAAIGSPVLLWHGSADVYVPIALARTLSSAIPGAALIEVPHGGHFMVTRLINSILERLKAEFIRRAPIEAPPIS